MLGWVVKKMFLQTYEDDGDKMTGGSPRSESPSPAPSEGLVYGQNMRVTVCANQGGRKYMEDRVHIHCARKEDGEIDYVFVAVYDGHGGAEASEYARRHLLDAIVGNELFQSDSDDQVLEAIRQGFVDTHHAMWKVVGTSAFLVRVVFLLARKCTCITREVL